MIREDSCRICISIILKRASQEKIETADERKALIDSCAENYIALSGENQFSDDEMEYIRRNVEYELSVTMKPGSALLDQSYVPWYFDRKSHIEPKFWSRYRKLLDRKLPVSVLGKLDLTTSEILDYAGDPTIKGKFQRKGLVVGDVQSGKTNCYLGVINKALDAGYNFVIVLAGMSEPLRAQTQMRVDEGITGFDSDPEKGKQVIGVGQYSTLSVFSVTSTAADFQSPMKATNANVAAPIVLVIKKNVDILDNVYEWLNVPQLKNSEGLIDKSLMVIDDEADNASINTLEQDVTHTNRSIRSILALFARSSYIGYTATPYANIFVDPDSYDDMIKEDLFPKDFIYAMWAPSNYIGPRSIFEENGTHRYMLRTIPDSETLLDGDLKHRKTARFETMPGSMKKAIACFFIACTMRDLNHDSESPMSMMIHITRFIDVQDSALDTISESIESLRQDIISYYALPVSEALKHPSIKFIHDVWAEEYSATDWPSNEWGEIQSRMPQSIHRIQYKIINSKNDKWIDYRRSPNLRAIVIGGNSLTRGLTLEGLMISYFYRKTKQYDTLLQMGRWFGYKNGYDVLCRVWTNPDVQSWFGYVGRVNEELKNSIDDMCELKKTPMEYGLRVQEDITGFTMTSRNKMRTSQVQPVFKNLSGDVRDSMYVYVDRDRVLQSHKKLRSFYETHRFEQRQNYGNVVFRNIPYYEVLDLMRGLAIPPHNVWYGYDELAEYISEIETKEWDVAVVSKDSSLPNGGRRELYDADGLRIYSPWRSRFEFKEWTMDEKPSIILMGNRNLKSPADFEEFLSPFQIESVKKKRNGNPSAKDYMISGRNPVLLIYYIDLAPDNLEDRDVEYYEQMMDDLDDSRPVGIAVGFPEEPGGSGSEGRRLIKYRANVISQRLREANSNAE